MTLKGVSPNDSFTLYARLRRWLDESPPATRNRISSGGEQSPPRAIGQAELAYQIQEIIRMMWNYSSRAGAPRESQFPGEAR
jgi:hypothetical protein